MRSYDVPRERVGVLGSLANDSLKDNVGRTKAELTASLHQMKESFEAVKAARTKILRAPSSRKVLESALAVLDDHKVGRIGKAWKAAKTELSCMLQEPKGSVAGEQYVTAYLKAIKAEYQRVKAKRQQMDRASVIDDLSEEAKQVLKKYDKQATKLEFGKRDYMISRAPVIPISSIPFDIATAKRAGLAVENIGGYLLLNNQMVLGFRRLDKGKAKDAVKEMVEQLTRATGRKLMLVTDRSAPYKGDIWFWIADQPTLNALRKAGHGTLQIRDWGFGFSSE